MRGKKLRVGIVGATGAVGREMLRCLECSSLEVELVRLFASHRSAGKILGSKYGDLVVEDLSLSNFEGLDIALFSAGKSVSLAYADRFLSCGCTVIDNSSAFRRDDSILLCVPEVNGDLIEDKIQIIANPNCSTIQLVLVLKVLDEAAGLERVQVASYQSCSGAGEKGVCTLIQETESVLRGEEVVNFGVHSRQIAFNVIPQIGAFNSLGYSEEEDKMMFETRKILGLSSLRISASCVRVPVFRGHSEVVHVKTRRVLSRQEAWSLLSEGKGLKVCDIEDVSNYPTALECSGRGEVFVGRIREDQAEPGGLVMWVVSDNLLKGAALNAVQIAERYWR